MAKTVVGLFESFPKARTAVEELVSSGFDRARIGIIANKGEQTGATGGGSAGDGDAAARGAIKGAGVGATAGGVVGGAGALIASLGALTIPGFGPVLAAGPLVALLTGAGVGAAAGAAAGGLIGALTKAGVPEGEARVYEEGIRSGGTLVTVQAEDNDADRAAEILNRNGAQDIDARGGAAGAQGSMTGHRRQETGNAGLSEARAGEEIHAEVIEEELRIGKREVDRGGVRVHTHVSERPVEETVDLREERVRVERHPVDRPATAADLDRASDQEVVVRASAEEAVVQKQARVVEEVVVRDTVRRKDVDVQPIAGQGATGGGGLIEADKLEPDFRGHYQKTFGKSGQPYDQYAPAYRYGCELAANKQNQQRDWELVRNDARRDFDKRQPGAFDRLEGAVHYGYDRARGRE
jgi:hypothetical protein